jgi:D-alanyl-D-alanine carboxypeptidase
MKLAQSLLYGGAAVVSSAAIALAPVSANAQMLTPESIVANGATSVQMQIQDNGITTNQNAGSLDNRGTPVGDQAYFRAGSVTKQFIATVMMQLSEEGKVNLDAHIDTYLPGKVTGGDQITTRQLLEHRSGLQEYLPSLPLYNIASYPSTPQKIQEMLDAAYNTDQLIGYINSRPLASTPGTTFAYANSNYVVAGEIIAKVTDKPYAKNIEKRILQPLGMNNTYLPGSDRNLPEPAARGYQDMSDPRVGGTAAMDMSTYNGSQVGASGEIVSTTGDLNKFTKALTTGKLVSAESYKVMTTPISNMGVESMSYGLGTMVIQTPCGDMIGHGGNIYGYATQMYSSQDGTKQVAVSTTEGKINYAQITVASQQLATQVMCQ